MIHLKIVAFSMDKLVSFFYDEIFNLMDDMNLNDAYFWTINESMGVTDIEHYLLNKGGYTS